MRSRLVAAVLVFLPAVAAFAAPSIESHDLTVRLLPAESRLEAEDRVVLRRDGGGELRFTLNAGLAVSAASLDGKPVALRKAAHGAGDGWREVLAVDVPAEGAERAVLSLTYAGRIADGIERREDSFVVGDSTRGLIVPEGAYLAESSFWYPTDGKLARFNVQTLPVAGWEVVTQGTRTAPAEPGGPTLWRGKHDADGLSLVAGPWTATRRRAGAVEIGAYLTGTNAAHADALLDLTAAYLKKYGAVLGPYAYDRFDIVDNFFTTGYGMPEFTLLGTSVIGRMVDELKRKGSVPAGYLGHEIVHCWWGNLVFPDYETGNWCEALTTYCANYAEKEEAGPADAFEHRRTAALRFTLRVNASNDYPVRAFRGKQEAADDDIGYGKGSMFFHSLRREIGDAAFWGTLRRVAAERRGRRFGWEDWRIEFEKSSRRSLGEFFAQGLDRKGAPLLELRDARVRTDGGVVRVTGVLRQATPPGEKPWRLAVPVVVEHVGGMEETIVDLTSDETGFSLAVPSMPIRISVDPDHHVFRTLGPEEVPACFAAARERPNVTGIVPDGDAGLARVAAMLATRPGVTVVAASAVKELARGTSYVVFGDTDRVPLLAALRDRLPRHFPPAGSKPETTMVLASSRSPADPSEFVTTAVGAPAALGARARFVLYYQFDGRVVFDGPVPKDRSQTPAPSRTSRLLLPDLKSATSPERARAVVDRLASAEMKGRLAGSPEDTKARRFIADELRMAGIEPDEVPFTFAVKRLDAARPVLSAVGATPGDAATTIVSVPLVASPETPEGGTQVIGSVEGDDADVAGRALVVDLGAGVENPLAFLRNAASLATARKAAALFVRVPKDAPAALAELWEFPERLHPDIAARLEQAKGRGGDGDPVRRAAGTAARIGSDAELPLPAVTVPHDFVAAKDRIVRLDVRFGRTEVRSANLVGVVRAKRALRRGGSLVLGAHVDHLGEGFPGADDNASGVAALLETVNVLTAHADLLAEDVTVVFFGAEEWGLRGSRAFVAGLAPGAVRAMVNADTVGRAGVDGVCVVGITHHPALGRVVAAAIEQSGLGAGREIDRYAFAHGSDHWSFHERGIPAVDLWSGDYGVMHSARDTAEGVDAAKAARVGRALALAALAIAGGL